MPCYAFLAALRLLIALPLLTASALLLAPHALNDDSNGVGLPSGVFCGPGIFPMRCKNAARRGPDPLFSGLPITANPLRQSTGKPWRHIRYARTLAGSQGACLLDRQ